MIRFLTIHKASGINTLLVVFKLRNNDKVTAEGCERDAIILNDFLRRYIPAVTLQILAERLNKTKENRDEKLRAAPAGSSLPYLFLMRY